MQISVVVASLGRPSEITSLLNLLNQQVLPPSRVVLSVERSEDLPSNLSSSIYVVYGSRGASIQRNRGIELALGGCDWWPFWTMTMSRAKHFSQAPRRCLPLIQTSPEQRGLC